MRDRVPGPVLSLPSSAAKKSTHHRTRDDNRGATRQVPASNPRRSDSGSHPSHSSSKTRDGGSLTATTAKLLEQVPSHRTHGEPALFGFRVPSFPSRHQPRRINPPPTERPNPPREDQGPSPPAGPHAFTCSRPGVTFPSPPCNRNST